jgi:hypothetical protein
MPIPADNFELLCDLADVFELGKKHMDKEQLINYLRDNLKVKVDVTQGAKRVICVKLLLEDELISVSASPIE